MTEIQFQTERDFYITRFTMTVGNIEIAHGFYRDQRSGRANFKVRLMFNQKRGEIDFTKDKEFQTLEECKEYVHVEFSKLIRRLAVYYGIDNQFSNQTAPSGDEGMK